jgi:hypothetical protein
MYAKIIFPIESERQKVISIICDIWSKLHPSVEVVDNSRKQVKKNSKRVKQNLLLISIISKAI